MASAQVDAHIAKSHIQRHGPYGSKLPQNFCFELQEGEQFKEVIIRHGFIVDAIGFVVAKPCGGTYTKMYGGNGGQESRIVLKCGEHITRISGTYGQYQYDNNLVVIATLKIHTNQCLEGYGPYGQGKGVHCAEGFHSPLFCGGPEPPAVGFFGRANCYLESLGIAVKTPVGAAN